MRPFTFILSFLACVKALERSRADATTTATTANHCPVNEATLKRIPQGTLHVTLWEERMGYPEHAGSVEVRFDYTFLAQVTEVTAAEFEAIMGTDPHQRPECADVRKFGVADDHPAVCVSWMEAVLYANRLSAVCGLDLAYRVSGDNVTWDPSANGYRLPTELEWEHAARGTLTSPWAIRSDVADLCDMANLKDRTWAVRTFNDGNSLDCVDSWAGTGSVRSRANSGGNGLFDIIGNAAEFVWTPAYARAQFLCDPSADRPATVPREAPIVAKGGNWRSLWDYAAVSARRISTRESFDPDLGFRLVRGPPGVLAVVASGSPRMDCAVINEQ